MVAPIEEVRAAPAGTYRLYVTPEANPNVEASMAAIDELPNRVAQARAADCWIEVLSLRLQYLDRWLRVFFANVPNAGARREQEFGRLLRQCFNLGLDKALYDRLHAFNKMRRDAIHGFLVGTISYAEIKDVTIKTDGISEAVAAWVLQNCGELLTPESVPAERFYNRGDAIQHIGSCVEFLRNRPPL